MHGIDDEKNINLVYIDLALAGFVRSVSSHLTKLQEEEKELIRKITCKIILPIHQN